MKKIIRILALLLALTVLAGCGASTKSYTCNELTMTVPAYMRDVSKQSAFSDYTFALDSSSMAIFALNETFADYPLLEEYTTKDYADLVVTAYELDAATAERSGKDYHYIVYTAETTKGEFTYMAGIFRNEKGFWMVQICSPTTKYDEQAFFSYMDTVNIG